VAILSWKWDTQVPLEQIDTDPSFVVVADGVPVVGQRRQCVDTCLPDGRGVVGNLGCDGGVAVP
jgi:hypothetical protein